MKYDLVIIGGGPAGLFAAANIDKNLKTLLIEKNEIPGKKLLMAGAGKCNFTHSGKVSDFFVHYGDNARFLRTALNKFSNEDSISFFKKNKIDSGTDKNGKVFPASEKARDILDTLIKSVLDNGVKIKSKATVVEIEKDEYFRVKTKEETFISNNIIIATGGKSYPSVGSSGDGYLFADKLGHTIIGVKPALTPVYAKNFVLGDLSGVSFINKYLSLFRNDKKVFENTGDFGITHKGLSGPLIIDNSRYFEKNDIIKINFIDITYEKFIEDFVKESQANGKKMLKNYLKNYNLPENFIKKLIELLDMKDAIKIAEVSKSSRKSIGEYLCAFPFIIDELGDYNIAMVTSGGINLKEINPKTMESKLVKGLYFGGEVMDIDGDSGGYNIQAAFSTGYLAAIHINEKSGI